MLGRVNFQYLLFGLLIVSIIFVAFLPYREGIDAGCLTQTAKQKVINLPINDVPAKWYNGNRVNYDLLKNIINIFKKNRDDIKNRFPINFRIGTIASKPMYIDQNSFPFNINTSNFKLTGQLPSPVINMVYPNSLEGDKGDTGIIGPDGKIGKQGPQGPQGLHGYC